MTTIPYHPIDSSVTFRVPPGVTEIEADLRGGEGGSVSQYAYGGKGGRLRTIIPVTPGEFLTICVGGKGTYPGTTHYGRPYLGGGEGGDGYRSYGGVNGAYGGGASAIFRGTTLLAVAGGGGGGGGRFNYATNIPHGYGGAGGGPVGQAGAPNATGSRTGGGGGSQLAGGAAGGHPTNGVAGQPGVALVAPTAVDNNVTCGGTGGPMGGWFAGGGGGGGYYGGGGGGAGSPITTYESGDGHGSGGGGGSSYSASTILDNEQGVVTGHGSITITYVSNRLTWTLSYDLAPDNNNSGGASRWFNTLNGVTLPEFQTQYDRDHVAGEPVWATYMTDVTDIFDPNTENFFRCGWLRGSDAGSGRRLRIKSSAGDTYYGEYPKGFRYTAEQWITGFNTFWEGTNFVGRGQWNQQTQAYVSNSSGPDNVSDYCNFYFTIPDPLLALAYKPIPESLHVYLNGVEQFEGVDWNLAAPVPRTGDSSPSATVWRVIPTFDMDIKTGDLLEARYVRDPEA